MHTCIHIIRDSLSQGVGEGNRLGWKAHGRETDGDKNETAQFEFTLKSLWIHIEFTLDSHWIDVRWTLDDS